ncbi:MAG TPA: hypothetical protein VGR73_04990 [Bryobacteraceae bacterium]|nr:hypothetical protein [Bryobacteraceae bacterium]
MRAAVCLFLLVVPVPAQNFVVATLSRRILTNESVVTLAKAGFDELFIVERIKTSRTRFDMSADGMVSLKGAGVTEDLIGAMAVQDRRNRLAALSAVEPSQNEAAPAGAVQPRRVMVVKHWWGFRWVRVFP